MRPRLHPGNLGIGYALAGFVAGIAAAVAPALLGNSASSLALLPLQYVLYIVFAVLIVRLVRWRKYQPSDLGLVLPAARPAWQPWLLGVVGGLLFVAIGQIAQRVSSGVGEAGKEVAQQIAFGQSLPRDIVVGLTITLLGPVAEEFIYRGLVFRGLFDGLARWRVPSALSFVAAAFVSSVLFSQSHGGQGQQKQFWFLVIFGMIASALYWWTGSLIVSGFAHVVCNSVIAATLLHAQPPTSPLIWVIPVLAPPLAVALMLAIRAAIPTTR